MTIKTSRKRKLSVSANTDRRKEAQSQDINFEIKM